MNIEDFCTIIRNIPETDCTRKDRVVGAISRLQISQCADPQIIHLRSAATGLLLPYEVPCGRCYHCRETKINEWVTRMCLETDAYKHCYFVTLTYRSYDNYEDIPDELLDAFWHYDNFNKNGRNCWSPCLIRGEHVSMFMRNLRNDTKNRDIKFFCGSEFGTTYGRPHHHVIMWSNEPIYITDVMKAWSHRLQNTSTYSGRFQHLRYKCYADGNGFDYNDLCTNGTLFTDNKAVLDGKEMSATNAFSYVAKYLLKGDNGSINFEGNNFARLRMFLDYLHQPNIDQRYMLVMAQGTPSKRAWNKIRKEKPNLFNTLPFIDYEDFVKLSETRPQTYELYHKHFSEEFAAFTMQDLCDLFGYRTTMSRGEGIGTLYALSNIERFAKGNTKFSSNLTERYGTLVFPSAFRRKIADFINPFTYGNYGQVEQELCTVQRNAERSSFVDETYCNNYGFSKQDNRTMASLFTSFLHHVAPYDDYVPYIADIQVVDDVVTKEQYHLIRGTCKEIFDKWTKTHYFINRNYDYAVIDDSGEFPFIVPYFTLQVFGIRFNRSTTNFDVVCSLPLDTFLSTVLRHIEKETSKALLEQQQHMNKFNEFKASKKKIKQFGMDFEDEMVKAKAVADAERVKMQQEYEDKHKYCKDNQ